MSVEDPGGKRWWRGGYVCECVTLIYPIMEARMIDAGVLEESFDFFQYCYNAGGVSASAGTHDAGGTTDHAQDDTTQLRIQRECGAAAWARTPAEGFDYHCHSVLCGCPHLSSGAADQVNDYKNGRNGLANNGPDTGPDVPYITWQDAYHKYQGSTTGGILGMTDQIYFHRSDDLDANQDGVWHDVPIEDGSDPAYSVVNGDTKQIICSASMLITGLKPGEMFDVCWREMRAKSGADNDYTSTRGPASPGANLGNVRAFYAGKLNKDGDGWKSRLRLSYRTDSPTAKITSILIEGWHS